MFEVLSITSVIFVLIALGFLAVRAAALSEGDLGALGKYVVSFALPALIFDAVSGRDLAEILNVGYLGGYLAGSLAVFAAGYWWSLRMAGQPPIAGTFQGMGVSCANSGFIDYPILLMAMPAVASTALALNMVVENLVMIPLVLALAERAGGGTVRGWALTRKILGRLIRNPIVLALIAGLAVSLLGLELPAVIAKPVGFIAASSAAVSLIVIGGTLAGLPLGAIDARVAAVVVGKLLLHPLAVWLGLAAMALAGFGVGDERLARAAVLIAATPAMGIYPILAQRYGQQGVAALAMLVMTALSFISISALLWLFDAAPAGSVLP